jgi:hypothetical protein
MIRQWTLVGRDAEKYSVVANTRPVQVYHERTISIPHSPRINKKKRRMQSPSSSPKSPPTTAWPMSALVAFVLLVVAFVGLNQSAKTIKSLVEASCDIESVTQDGTYCCTRQCTNCVFSSSQPECDSLVAAYQSVKPSDCPASPLCPPVYPLQSSCQAGSGGYTSNGVDKLCIVKHLAPYFT